MWRYFKVMCARRFSCVFYCVPDYNLLHLSWRVRHGVGYREYQVPSLPSLKAAVGRLTSLKHTTYSTWDWNCSWPYSPLGIPLSKSTRHEMPSRQQDLDHNSSTPSKHQLLFMTRAPQRYRVEQHAQVSLSRRLQYYYHTRKLPNIGIQVVFAGDCSGCHTTVFNVAKKYV